MKSKRKKKIELKLQAVLEVLIYLKEINFCNKILLYLFLRIWQKSQKIYNEEITTGINQIAKTHGSQISNQTRGFTPPREWRFQILPHSLLYRDKLN